MVLSWNDSGWTSQLPKHQGFGKYLVDNVDKLHLLCGTCMQKETVTVGKVSYHYFTKGPLLWTGLCVFQKSSWDTLDKLSQPKYIEPTAVFRRGKKSKKMQRGERVTGALIGPRPKTWWSFLLRKKSETDQFQLVSWDSSDWCLVTWDATPQPKPGLAFQGGYLQRTPWISYF